MPLQQGIRVKRYVVNEMIARGGMGVVWDGWDDDHDQPVAIKAVANNLMRNPEFKVRIQDEARRHQRLDHPNIVPVLDIFEANGETCIVMQRIKGDSLNSFLNSMPQERLEIHKSIAIIKDILDALDAAHQHGIVHRDVKPSNVLLDENHRPFLIDFGIAIAVGEERRTRAGQPVGTPTYMSPEQITHPLRIDHRSDVYNAGCVLYRMLAGRPPFVRGEDGVGDTGFDVQQAHVFMTPVSLNRRVPEIPEALNDVVMAALEKDPDNRIPGCREFLRMLEDAVSERSNGNDAPAPETIPKSKLRIPLVVGLLLILVFLIVLAFLN